MAIDDLLRHQPPRITEEPATAVVVRVDEDGSRWVAPVGDDPRHPIGPCRGAAGAPVGAIGLLIWTDDGPWIAAWEA